MNVAPGGGRAILVTTACPEDRWGYTSRDLDWKAKVMTKPIFEV